MVALLWCGVGAHGASYNFGYRYFFVLCFERISLWLGGGVGGLEPHPR